MVIGHGCVLMSCAVQAVASLYIWDLRHVHTFTGKVTNSEVNLAHAQRPVPEVPREMKSLS